MTLRCRLLGHDIPGRISAFSHPQAVTVERVYTDGAAQGRCGPIVCQRCGKQIDPMDRDYPTIAP